MIRIGLPGRSGRMRTLVAAEIAARSDCVVAGDFHDCDVVIDFTTVEATPRLIAAALRTRTPYVCCTTGIDMAPVHEAAKFMPVLYAANTSLSLAVAKKAVADMARLLAPHKYAVAVHDAHHRHKKDAPSGTAKMLGAAAGGNVAYTSVREGDIVGEHTVTFTGPGESISLHHSVADRGVFARGAIQAALWLTSRGPGLYSMDDVLGLG